MNELMMFLGYGLAIVAVFSAVLIFIGWIVDLISDLYWRCRAKRLPYILDLYKVAMFISPVNNKKYFVVFKCDNWYDYDFIVESTSWQGIGAEVMSHFKAYLKNREKMFD